MTLEELKTIVMSVPERRGWDFTCMQADRDPVPWDYADVVRRYLRPSSCVLDVGTGGGERFLALTSQFGTGVGIDADPRMIEVALENRFPSLIDKVSFKVMRAEALQFSEASFDVVLNRHAPVHVEEIVRVLRPQGVFITEQVGARNAQNICAIFGCKPGGSYESNPSQNQASLTKAFQRHGCHVICDAEYDARYYFLDVESLIFWLKAIPIPEDFDIEKHWRQVKKIITEYHTTKGIETNEHRELLIAQKR